MPKPSQESCVFENIAHLRDLRLRLLLTTKFQKASKLKTQTQEEASSYTLYIKAALKQRVEAEESSLGFFLLLATAAAA